MPSVPAWELPSVPAWALPRHPCWTFVTLESSIFLHLS